MVGVQQNTYPQVWTPVALQPHGLEQILDARWLKNPRDLLQMALNTLGSKVLFHQIGSFCCEDPPVRTMTHTPVVSADPHNPVSDHV